MTAINVRLGRTQSEIRLAISESSVGYVLVAKSGRGICAILLGNNPEVLTRDLQKRFPDAVLLGADSDLEDALTSVVRYIDKPTEGIDLSLGLSLDLQGTEFQQRVWKALLEIPVGSTASYQTIANRIGLPKSVRAVAQACGANALAVVIPCHRVVRSDGALSGYRWGIDRKRALLNREAYA